MGIARTVVAAAVLAVVSGCGGGSDPRGVTQEPASSVFRGDGLSARIPPGWHVTARPLTDVSSPVQQLVVTSFRFRQKQPDGNCSPTTALGQMPATGALLYMFEYRGPTRHDAAQTPARPDQFRLDPKTLLPYECMGRSYMVRFRDHGRVFQAHMYVGAHASERTRHRLTGILDSLRVSPQTPRAAAVWVQPKRLFSRFPYMGVACRTPNSIRCDRVGLSVWLRHPAAAVTATIDGLPLALDDPRWSGPIHDGRRKTFAGFLHPAGLLHGPLAIHTSDGKPFWSGSPPVKAAIALTIERDPQHFIRTSLVVQLAPGWG